MRFIFLILSALPLAPQAALGESNRLHPQNPRVFEYRDKPLVLDFTIQNRLETGRPEAQQHLRTWLKHLSTFVHSLDLAKARPLPQMVKAAPEHVIASVLGVAGQDYAIYLADAHEVTDVGLGDPIHGELIATLPEGIWQAAFIHPVTGLSSEGPSIQGGEARLQLPEFRHDLAISLRRQ